MVTKVTFLRIKGDNRIAGEAWFDSDANAINAFCAWNCGRNNTGWLYALTSLERVVPTDRNYQVTSYGQLVF